MNELSADALKYGFLGTSGVVATLLAWNGWRQGFARQGMSLLAIVGAYAAGFFGRKTAAPAFGFLGYPEFITEIIGGVTAGMLTFIAVSALGRTLFKKTATHKPGASRMGWGAGGAALGLVLAAALFMMVYYAVRMTGTIAASQVHVATEQAAAPPGPGIHAAEDPGVIIRSLAKLNKALDEGATGEIMHKVDRVPPNVYAMLFKLGIMASSETAVDRFLNYPGVADLAFHPKIKTLKEDPEILELLAAKSYLRLLRHEKIVNLANDQEFAAQIKKMDFDKALDFAIKGK